MASFSSLASPQSSAKSHIHCLFRERGNERKSVSRLELRSLWDNLLLWYASIVAAFKVRLQGALGAVVGQFIAVVAAIVLAITEQPFGNATIV